VPENFRVLGKGRMRNVRPIIIVRAIIPLQNLQTIEKQ